MELTPTYSRKQPDDLLFSHVRTGEISEVAEVCRVKCDGVASCKAFFLYQREGEQGVTCIGLARAVTLYSANCLGDSLVCTSYIRRGRGDGTLPPPVVITTPAPMVPASCEYLSILEGNVLGRNASLGAPRQLIPPAAYAFDSTYGRPP